MGRFAPFLPEIILAVGGTILMIVAAFAHRRAAGVVSWLAYELMLGALPGSSLAMQIIRLLVTIGVSLAALAGMAQLLRIQEFGEARDLALRRFKRITG